MSDQHSQNALRQLTDYTQRMLAAAEAGNWDLIDELESARSAQLETCFSGTPRAADADDMAASLSALIVLNDRLVARVAEERSAVIEHSQSLRKARTASTHYTHFQPG